MDAWCLPREQRQLEAFPKPPGQWRRPPQVTALGPGTEISRAHGTTPWKEKVLKCHKYWPREQLGVRRVPCPL